MTPAQLREQIREVKQLTLNQFGVNLFVPSEFKVSKEKIELADKLLDSIRRHLNIEKDQRKIADSQSYMEAFHEQVGVLIEEKVSICSFTFGIPSESIITDLKKHRTILIGTATTVIEAVEVEKKGMDFVVVQGSEAGGHRGNFLNGHQESLIGLMSLIPQTVDAVKIPVIAAGGIMDGRGLTASLCLGAKGVQMGTAFLTCVESGAHPLHKDAILRSIEDQTSITRAFSGKWARGIKNQFISDMQEFEASFPDYPVQNSLTQSIRKASAMQNNPEYMSLWSGQSPRLAKNQTAGDLIENIISEAEKQNGNRRKNGL